MTCFVDASRASNKVIYRSHTGALLPGWINIAWIKPSLNLADLFKRPCP